MNIFSFTDRFSGRLRKRGAARLGLLLILLTTLPISANVVTILVPAPGLDERNAAILSETSDYLSDTIEGHTFRMVRGNANYWLADVRNNSVDFVFGDSAELILMETVLESRPIAGIERHYAHTRVRNAGGVIVSLREKALANANALTGQVVGKVEGQPMLSWIAVNRELMDQGVDLKRVAARIERFPNDQAVVHAILNGTIDVGIITSGVLETMADVGVLKLSDLHVLSLPGRGNDPFPYLVSTRRYPEKRLMALQGVSDDLTRRVAAALLAAEPIRQPGSGRFASAWTIPHSCAEARAALQDLRMPPYENYGRIEFSKVVRAYMYWFLGAGMLFVVLGTVTSYIAAMNSTLKEEAADRLKAQRLLNVSIDRFEHVALLSGDWIWETDTEERFIYSNNSLPELLGWQPDEVMGKRFSDLISSVEKDAQENPDRMLHDMATDGLQRRIKMVTSEGRVSVHECKVAPIRDPKRGSVIGYRGVHRDVTGDTGMVTFE